MLALTFLPPVMLGSLSAVPVASFAGALGAVLIVYALARVRQRGLSTDVLLLAPAAVGVLLAAARAWDALADPIAGSLSDGTRTRWGVRVDAGRTWARLPPCR